MASCRNCGHGSIFHAGVPGEKGVCHPDNYQFHTEGKDKGKRIEECSCLGFNFENTSTGSKAAVGSKDFETPRAPQPATDKSAPTKAAPKKEKSK